MRAIAQPPSPVVTVTSRPVRRVERVRLVLVTCPACGHRAPSWEFERESGLECPVCLLAC